MGSLLNDLSALDVDVVLVLDDYHLVESLAVQESMQFLLAHQPAQLHLVVASRADPPWPIAGLRARGDLVEVRAGDLRFTPDEATAYLNGAMGLDLRELGRRFARGSDGGMGRRAPVGRAVAARPGRPFCVHRGVRR